MLLVQTMLMLTTGFWCGPDAAKARVTAGDGVCKIGRAVVLPMCGEDKGRAVRVAVAADEPGCDSARRDGKRCVVVRRAGPHDEGEQGAPKQTVCKKVIVCGDEGTSKQIIRKKVMVYDDAGQMLSCCGPDDSAGCCRGVKVGKGGLVSWTPSAAEDRQYRVLARKSGSGEGDGAKAGRFFVTTGCSDDPNDAGLSGSNPLVMIAMGEDPEDEDELLHGDKDIRWVTRTREGDVAPGGPWLGIQFGPIPKALAAHLSMDKDLGQMILNIIEDSPADEAGLQQYDVIVQVDGKDAPADIEKFMSAVREFEPGERHEFALIRGGRQIKVTMTVGKRPEKVGASKYDSELEELSKADVLHHGGILRKDSEGNWKFENLGDLKEMHKLWQHMPDEQAFEHLFKWSGSLPGSQCDFDIETKEGKLQIERTGDKTTVTRTKVDGDKRQVTTKTYDSDEEFKKDDPEAYKMMKKHTCFEFQLGKGPGCLVTPGGETLKFLGKGSDFDFNLQELMKNAGEMRKHAAEAGAEARKAYEEAARLHADKNLGGLFVKGKAGTSFEVTADGEIKVTTRKGDEELTRTYADAAALKKARPDLYEKFRKLQGAGEGSKTKTRVKTDD